MKLSFYQNPKSVKDRHGIVVLVIGCGALVVFLVAYAVVFGRVSAKAEHVAQLFSQYDVVAGKDTRQTALRAALRDTEPQVRRLDGLFLHGDAASQSQFVNTIESLGTQIGLDTRVTGLNEKSATMLSVDLEATGSFAKVMQLVKLIELLPYKISVTKVYLSSQATAGVAPTGDVSKGSASRGSVWKTSISFDVVSYLQQP
ncbi:MAG: hypothetical protein ACYC8S_03145 [Minisyncoccota bacterium]